jgi:hypothetical protein
MNGMNEISVPNGMNGMNEISVPNEMNEMNEMDAPEGGPVFSPSSPERDSPDKTIKSVMSGALTSRVRVAEKNKFGEVFTPDSMINDMLAQLPPEIWSDRTKKWLDPAAGFGNFLSVVYRRLMTGLEDVIPKNTERRQHIQKHMLYMVEYNEASCERIREIYGKNVNLFCGSFLDPNGPIFSDGTTRFDVIVGNPPFNADQVHAGKKGGGNNLWPKFVEKSLSAASSLLLPNGYLVFVHPALWRKPPSSRAKTWFTVMTHDNHMKYLEIHSKADGKRDFKVQTRYDFYIIQKRRPTPGKDTTIVKDQTGEIRPAVDLSRWNFLPNHSYEVIEPLLRPSGGGEGVEGNDALVIFSRGQYGTDNSWVTPEPPKDTARQVLPLIHSTPLGGRRIYYTSKKKEDEDCVPMFGVPKVIFGETGINNQLVIDVEGQYGMTQGAIGLKIPGLTAEQREAEAREMAAVLKGGLFKKILDAMSFSNFRIDWRMFLYLRPDFYKHPMFQSSLQSHPRDIMRFTETATAASSPTAATAAAASSRRKRLGSASRKSKSSLSPKKKKNKNADEGGGTRRRRFTHKRRR